MGRILVDDIHTSISVWWLRLFCDMLRWQNMVCDVSLFLDETMVARYGDLIVRGRSKTGMLERALAWPDLDLIPYLSARPLVAYAGSGVTSVR